MDSIYKIKRICYKPSALTPGCLFANSVRSPFIRLYLGKDEFGNHLHRIIRSYDRAVCFSLEKSEAIYFNHAHIVVLRGE